MKHKTKEELINIIEELQNKLEIAENDVDYWQDIVNNREEDCLQEKICSECGNHMNSGYCIENGLEYYCSDECLHKNYTDEEYEQLYDNGNGDSYWTEWEM